MAPERCTCGKNGRADAQVHDVQAIEAEVAEIALDGCAELVGSDGAVP
jgi:hypothetical protein